MSTIISQEDAARYAIKWFTDDYGGTEPTDNAMQRAFAGCALVPKDAWLPAIREQIEARHPEIFEYRQHLRANRGVSFMFGLEQQDYEEQIKQALTHAIPRLYALEYGDQLDVPIEVYRLVERLEIDLQLDLSWESETP